MDAKDIKSVDDVSNYIEGCLNDFDEGLSTKDETNKYLHELVAKVILMTQATKDKMPTDEEMIEASEKIYGKNLHPSVNGAKLDGFATGVNWLKTFLNS